MNNMRKIQINILILLSIFYTSCTPFFYVGKKSKDTEETIIEPKCTLEREWTLQLSVKRMQSDDKVFQDGRYLYINEQLENKEDLYVSKIDLETGKYVWKSLVREGGYLITAPTVLKRDGKKYVFALSERNGSGGQSFFCFDETTGELLASIFSKGQYVGISDYILSCNGNIYY